MFFNSYVHFDGPCLAPQPVRLPGSSAWLGPTLADLDIKGAERTFPPGDRADEVHLVLLCEGFAEIEARELVNHLELAVCLLGARRARDGRALKGQVTNGQREVSGWGDVASTVDLRFGFDSVLLDYVPPWFKDPWRTWSFPTVDPDLVATIDGVVMGLRRRREGGRRFSRLWHGLCAYQRSIYASIGLDLHERGFNLIRALEALLFHPLQPNLRGRQFGERIQWLVDGPNAAWFADLYKYVRNAAVHMHPRVDPSENPGVVAQFTMQIYLLERVVEHVYRHILATEEMLDGHDDVGLIDLWEDEIIRDQRWGHRRFDASWYKQTDVVSATAEDPRFLLRHAPRA